MKKSKINNETPEKIISTAIYTLCSCGPCSGLEGITKNPQPSIRFPGWVTFPTLCACRAELELDTSDLLCLHRMFACHTQPSLSWDSRHPNSFMPKRGDSQGLVCRKCLRALSCWQSCRPIHILRAFSFQRWRKQRWEFLTEQTRRFGVSQGEVRCGPKLWLQLTEAPWCAYHTLC